MKFINCPIDILNTVVAQNWPDFECNVLYTTEWDLAGKEGPEEHEAGSGPFGCTRFPDDDSTPEIYLSCDLPIAHLTEIYAHELAHAILGKEHGGNCDGHTPEWEAVFEQIHILYETEAMKREVEYRNQHSSPDVRYWSDT